MENTTITIQSVAKADELTQVLCGEIVNSEEFWPSLSSGEELTIESVTF